MFITLHNSDEDVNQARINLDLVTHYLAVDKKFKNNVVEYYIEFNYAKNFDYQRQFDLANRVIHNQEPTPLDVAYWKFNTREDRDNSLKYIDNVIHVLRII